MKFFALLSVVLACVSCGDEAVELSQGDASTPDCRFSDIGNAEFCADGTMACLARDGHVVTGCILRWQDSKDAEGSGLCSTNCENSNRTAP